MDNITKQNGNEVGKRQVEGQTIIINQQERRSTNGLGTAGFILALLGLIFSWVPGLGWVLRQMKRVNLILICRSGILSC